MPLVRVSPMRGKSPEHVRAVSDGVHRGLMSACGVPADDRFQLIHQRARGELVYDADCLGLHRTDDIVIDNIIAVSWRNTAQKKALYRAVTGNLVENSGLRPEGVLTSPHRRRGTSGPSATASRPTSGTTRLDRAAAASDATGPSVPGMRDAPSGRGRIPRCGRGRMRV